MASSTQNCHARTQHLPPSPPMTPPLATKRRPKKRSNSFDKLASTPFPSPTSNPALEADGEQESLLARIILTPVLVTSFILSLFFVNARNRALRVEAHSAPSSLLSALLPATSEPYQDHHDSTWSHRGSTEYEEPDGAIAPRNAREKSKSKSKKKKSWHLHKKIRKIAKLEVSDALEMRGTVISIMLVVMALGSIGLLITVKWFMAALSV